MKKVFRIGGAYGLLLSQKEMEDMLECVQAYCIGDTSPSAAPDPDIAEFYPNERFTPLIDERFWRLHAALANATNRGTAEAQGDENEG